MKRYLKLQLNCSILTKTPQAVSRKKSTSITIQHQSGNTSVLQRTIRCNQKIDQICGIEIRKCTTRSKQTQLHQQKKKNAQLRHHTL